MSVNWPLLFGDKNINEKFETFLETFDNIYKKNCPIKTKKSNIDSVKSPWLDEPTLRLIKNKYTLLRLKNNKIISDEYYREFCQDTERQIKKRKETYYINKLQHSKNNKKWDIIKESLGFNKNPTPNDCTNITLSTDIGDISNQITVASELNKHFVSIGKKTANSVNTSRHHFSEYLNNPNKNFFKFFEIVPNEIQNTINSCKNKKCSVDKIPIKIYKAVSDIISRPLCTIFNESINLGIFPNTLKIGKIRPLFKAGDKKLASNYRPITILPTLSKIFEKLVFSRMYNFLNKFGLLHSCQFGFRKLHNTSHALSAMTKTIYEKLNDRHNVLALYIDLQKAFDVLDHNILIKKLNYLGIRGSFLNWLTSFLSNRHQCVELDNNTKSNLLPISHGIPQGSVLGPLLFTIFINDIFTCSPFQTFSFADDTTCISSAHSMNDLYEIVNRNLIHLYDWLCANKLKLNASKTKYMLFTNKKYDILPLIKINNQTIEKTENIKVLGITIDEKLTFRNHICNINRKLAFTSHIIKRLAYMKLNILQTIYYAYAYSALIYANTIWGNSARCHSNILQVTQNTIIRNIWGNHNIKTDKMFLNLKILKINQIFNYSINSLMYKIISKQAPTFVIDAIMSNQRNQVNSYNTRHNSLITKTQFTLSLSCQCFTWQGPHYWNNLSRNIKNATNMQSFKRLLLLSYFN